MAIFNKTKDKKKKDIKAEDETVKQEEAVSGVVLSDKMLSENSDAHRILKNFYISEKSAAGAAFNQYVFKVFKDANKPQIRSKVEKLFNVKVKDVKILNMPEKRKDLGRHPGFKSGFKKAIVVLEKGHTIEQAKA